MKKLVLIVAMVMFLGMGTLAQATLIDQGADTLGNHIFYDDDKDITWYDFTNHTDTWANQMSWAEGLVVTMPDGRSFTDWRLPTTPGTSYGGNQGWEGTLGNNEGEIGHLWFDELVNRNYWPPRVGPFQHLLSYSYYWTGSTHGEGWAWEYLTYPGGHQWDDTMLDPWYAMAVRDNTAVPEPATIGLLSLGALGLIRRKRSKA